MKIKDIALSAAYVGQSVVKAICVGAQEVWSAVKYIVFADPVVEQICATNFGNGNGLTEEQAAKVTTINSPLFRDNKSITSFDELQYFTNLKTLGIANTPDFAQRDSTAVFRDSSLESIVLPEGLEEIGAWTFRGCTNLASINLPKSIKKLGQAAFQNVPCEFVINLPNLELMYAYESYGLCNTFISTGLTRIENLGLIDTLWGGHSESGLDYGVFANCQKLTYANLSNVKEVKKYAFKNCTSLSSVVFEQIRVIRAFGFEGCVSLETVDLPNTIENIEYNA
jgi:hypothetical protein